jgi:hypothetical protein
LLCPIQLVSRLYFYSFCRTFGGASVLQKLSCHLHRRCGRCAVSSPRPLEHLSFPHLTAEQRRGYPGVISASNPRFFPGLVHRQHHCDGRTTSIRHAYYESAPYSSKPRTHPTPMLSSSSRTIASFRKRSQRPSSSTSTHGQQLRPHTLRPSRQS